VISISNSTGLRWCTYRHLPSGIRPPLCGILRALACCICERRWAVRQGVSIAVSNTSKKKKNPTSLVQLSTHPPITRGTERRHPSLVQPVRLRQCTYTVYATHGHSGFEAYLQIRCIQLWEQIYRRRNKSYGRSQTPGVTLIGSQLSQVQTLPI
jgi:hypothetical protein